MFNVLGTNCSESCFLEAHQTLRLLTVDFNELTSTLFFVFNHFESKTHSSSGLGFIYNFLSDKAKLDLLLQWISVYIFIRHLKLCAILNIFIKGLVLFQKSDGILNKWLLKWFLRAFRKLWIIRKCHWHFCSSMQSVQCLQIANLLNVIKLIGSINSGCD